MPPPNASGRITHLPVVVQDRIDPANRELASSQARAFHGSFAGRRSPHVGGSAAARSPPRMDCPPGRQHQVHRLGQGDTRSRCASSASPVCGRPAGRTQATGEPDRFLEPPGELNRSTRTCHCDARTPASSAGSRLAVSGSGSPPCRAGRRCRTCTWQRDGDTDESAESDHHRRHDDPTAPGWMMTSRVASWCRTHGHGQRSRPSNPRCALMGCNHPTHRRHPGNRVIGLETGGIVGCGRGLAVILSRPMQRRRVLRPRSRQRTTGAPRSGENGTPGGPGCRRRTGACPRVTRRTRPAPWSDVPEKASRLLPGGR